jgi:DNA-binding NtrC family response regulator
MDADAAPAEPRKTVVLVIEDDVMVRRTIVLFFARAGYEVLEAGSAAEACTQWETHHAQITAVVSDNMLGVGPTGLSLLRQFLVARPTLTAVLISGVLTFEVMHNIQTASTIRCLQKPFAFRDLVELVTRRTRELAST